MAYDPKETERLLAACSETRIDAIINQLEAAAERIAELEKDAKAYRDRDIIAVYTGKEDRRDWWSGGCWLHPGEEVCVLRAAHATKGET